MTVTAIQAVYVRAHEERPEPKRHIVFRIEIQAHVRSWHMWRRYSEFVDLHTELTKSVGAPPPSPLPPKHAFAMLRTSKNEALLEERRAGLEAYLRAIQEPNGNSSSGNDAGGGAQFTSSTWLDEHMDLQARVRDVRADVNRRDAFSDRGDVGAAHGTNVQAKKKLAGVLSRLGALAEGLDVLALRGMSEGELQRRTDMVARLQDDCEKLAKMLTVARHTSRGLGSAAERTADSDRAALLGGAAASSSSKPIARLDDQGLVQLQQTEMEQQDTQLAQLTAILQRQKQLGIAINNELAQHMELLDGLSDDMDRVGGKLTAAKKQLNRLG
ncbi:syntaxin [Lactarius hatsudake]|nr:syntaxin [Lactarius hatsudake]